MAAPQPEPGRCAYFVARKKRFCRMVPALGRRFCGEHGQQEVPGGESPGGCGVPGGVGALRQPPPPPAVVAPLHGRGRPVSPGVLRAAAQR